MQIKIYVRVYLGENGAEFPLTLEQRSKLDSLAEKILSGKQKVRPLGLKQLTWKPEEIERVKKLTTMSGLTGVEGRKQLAKELRRTEGSIAAKWYELNSKK